MIVYEHHDTSKTIGGKGEGLFKLKKAGVAVPEFFVIPAEFFDPFINDFKVKDDLNQSCLKKSLLDVTIPDGLLADIERILSSWNFPHQPVVIRSSISDEDGKKDAFPGMMDSFLNLITMEGVLSSIKKCASSAYSERAIAYRKQKKLTCLARPAVIVQKQIEADSSGVIFSTFPEYPQELAIHAVYGLGEGLMSGSLEPDEFYFLKESGRLHRKKIAVKNIIYKSGSASGLITETVPENKQDLACLGDVLLQNLFNTATILEQKLNHPQDIEFVVKNNTIYYVQSRPVTQQIATPVIYDNSNIQESYCGVTTPLTFSFACRAYATVYKQTMAVLGISKKLISENEATVSQLLGLIKGRIYYNINNWYKGLQLLPSFKQNKADMERMMGLQDPVDFVEDREKSFKEKVALLPKLSVNLVRLILKFQRLNSSVSAFKKNFQSSYNEFYKQDYLSLNASELLKHKKYLDENLLKNWTTPIINDFYVMMTNGSTVRQLKKAGIENVDDFLSRYLSGDKQIESTLPVTAIQQLSVIARNNLPLCNLILVAPDDLHEQVKTKHPDFFLKIMQFIELYGDRTVGELKLETHTMRVNNLIFYKYLKNYLVNQSLSSDPPHQNKLHEQALKELEHCLDKKSFIFKRRLFNNFKKLQKAIRFRESMRLERTRLFGMYRTLFLALGDRMMEEKIIEHPRDIFYLTEDEIESNILRKETRDINLKLLIKERKEEFLSHTKEDVPSRITIPSPPIETKVEDIAIDGQLKGTGCYPGIVIGEVIVISSPEDDLDVNGKIVCALRTDPGWAALFPSCKAVIIEKGSSLSHSVILLRELEIPAIINVVGLTKKLKSGDRITLNGGSGEINLL